MFKNIYIFCGIIGAVYVFAITSKVFVERNTIKDTRQDGFYKYMFFYWLFAALMTILGFVFGILIAPYLLIRKLCGM